MPLFIASTGAIVEGRFINVPGTRSPDGNVRQNFRVVGRRDAHGWSITEPDSTTASSTGNLALGQVPPTYGDGLIEVVRNIDSVNNMNSNLSRKASLGITGHPNYSGNDGSIQRFGWKAQVRSTLLMAAQQMNVEMGVTNETFPNEIDQTPGCVFNGVPETVTNFTPGILTEMFPGDAERTESVIQWMAPPTAAPSTPSINNGRTQFTNAGWVMCHTTSYKTPATSRPALGNLPIKLYSDLPAHPIHRDPPHASPQGESRPLKL